MDSSSLTLTSLRERRPSSNVPRLSGLGSLSTINPTHSPLRDPEVGNKDNETALDDDEDDIVHAQTSAVALPASSNSAPEILPSLSSAPQTPMTEMSKTPTDEPSPLFSQPSTPELPIRMYRRFASSFLLFFGGGWADGTPGTILPYLEKDFGLTYFAVSFIFVSAAAGFAIGTVLNEPLIIYLGRFPLTSEGKRTFIPYFGFSIDSNSSQPAKDRSFGHSLVQGRFYALLISALLQLVCSLQLIEGEYVLKYFTILGILFNCC
jgi:hypothetical protein